LSIPRTKFSLFLRDTCPNSWWSFYKCWGISPSKW